MAPARYVVLQHAVRRDRPVRAYDVWVRRIPEEYRRAVLGEEATGVAADGDEHRLAILKHYRSSMPLAQDARKPLFFLKPADGAIGSHSKAVQDCRRDLEQLARRIAARVGVAMPPSPTALPVAVREGPD